MPGGKSASSLLLKVVVVDTASKLLGTSIDDRQEAETEQEEENEIDDKCIDDVVPTEVNLSENGSSKPAQEASSLGTLSRAFEQVPQTQHKSMILKKIIEIISALHHTPLDILLCFFKARFPWNKSKSGELTEMTPVIEEDSGIFQSAGNDRRDSGELSDSPRFSLDESDQISLPRNKTRTNAEAIEKIELDTGIFHSAGNDRRDLVVSGELRKTPRFSLEESDQTTLPHNNKTRTNQAVSAEEKTVGVERSDSDKSRAPLLILSMTADEKGKIVVKLEKGVEESRPGTIEELVASVKGGGKRNPRPSLFSCVCCGSTVGKKPTESLRLIYCLTFDLNGRIEWLNTGNEMGNNNVSGIKDEEKTTVEVQEDTSQHANPGDDERRENPKGEGKDFHEKVEGLSSGIPLGGGDPPVAKQTSDGKELEPHAAEPLELKSHNQDEHSEARREPPQEVHEGSLSYPTEDRENLLEAEENQNLDDIAVLDANIDQEITTEDSLIKETSTQGKLLGTRITNNRREIGTKDEVENGFDNKCSEEAPTEVNLSRNGSSKPAEEAISQGTLSNTFEKVPQIQDKSLILNENKETIESKSENEDTEEALNESNTDEVNSPQSELVMVGYDSRNGKENIESRELTEMTPIMETGPIELPTTQCKEEEEETEQTEEKIIEAIEVKRENFMVEGISTEARKRPKLDSGIFQSAGDEAVDIAVAELRTSPRFNFDLSMEARFEEFDRSPSMHNKKTRTRSLPILNGATSFGNPIQDQAVSAEDKSIEVERSDSDRSRAPFRIFLVTDEEKGNAAEKLKKEDCRNKGVDESWTVTSKEVALIMGSGKRKPRPSLFTCIRRAAAIN
ncbi:hypothetical protein RHMOL_Rhmol04G0321600 [Rhododendron molle]|uniref:Uncharacterized protein n=1 Tax=Rhododendron molle TaxID=49168 RepID=A0ACC0P933_RHOML|nr:hypothetical protein RHMOL_Rhmol04G0321600 [Rhododendron molle]